MNIILLNKNDFIEKSIVSLSGDRAEHISNVLHTESGQSLKVGLLNGNIGKGKLISINDNCIKLEVNDLNIPPHDPLPITLIIAMQRPKTMRKILQTITAMGVKKLFIIETWKVEKSYWNSPLLLPENIKKELLLGLQQGGDTIIPQVIIKKRFKPFVEDELPAITNNTMGLIAHPESIMACPHQVDVQLTVAIGPEGGFTDYEVNKICKTGMKPVNIGKRTLRSEFAVTAILAKLF